MVLHTGNSVRKINQTITIPYKRPIKEIYVKMVLKLLEL